MNIYNKLKNFIFFTVIIKQIIYIFTTQNKKLYFKTPASWSNASLVGTTTIQSTITNQPVIMGSETINALRSYMATLNLPYTYDQVYGVSR